jgi:hypothetical protein
VDGEWAQVVCAQVALVQRGPSPRQRRSRRECVSNQHIGSTSGWGDESLSPNHDTARSYWVFLEDWLFR